MIHTTAIIDPSAKIAQDVEIGPYSIIGAHVEIGAGTVVGPHVVIKGPTVIGKNNRIFQFASVGEDCQDKNTQENLHAWSSVTTTSFVNLAPFTVVQPKTKA